MTQQNLIIDEDYVSLINDIKKQVKSAQIKAHRAVNTELITMYWSIGKELLARQKTEKWGSKYLEQVSTDLRMEFSGIHGFSLRNLKYMRQLATAYPNPDFGQQAVAQLPWGHLVVLLEKIKEDDSRNWYAQQTLEQGWSRNVLSMMITSELHKRQDESLKLTNFKKTLPAPSSDMAQAMFKDPFCFEFLNIQKPQNERDIEEALVRNIRDFLLHLGKGFAFIGNQYKIVVGGDEFFIDMLFFNIPLNAYFVIELKTGKYTPADIGQLNFYLTAVDELVKEKHHAQTIGLILCESKNEVVVEYSLKKVESPIGISQYELGKALTQHLKIHSIENTKEVDNREFAEIKE
jgi:predicted nuclease of restriction endonuclease-like (RecB) superfamily